MSASSRVVHASPAANVENVQPRAHALVADWKFVVGAGLIALLITSVPYLFALLLKPEGREFIGIIYNVPDIGQYLAWMRASQSAVLISNTLTPEPNAPVFFNLTFWLLGRFAALTGLELVPVFNLFRLVGGAFFVGVLYYFCALVLPERRQTRTAFLIILFSSGVSAFLIALGKLGINTHFDSAHVAEGTTLYSMMAFPLLTFGMGLFTLILAWVLRAFQTLQWRYVIGAGLVGFGLGWSHGYDLILVYSVLGVFTLVMLLRDGWRWDWLARAGAIIALSCLPSLYFVMLTRTNSVWREVLAQFVNAGVFSPNPLNLFLLMGLPLAIALISFDGVLPLRAKSVADLFVKCWFGVNFLLIYLPVEYQIHLINGWQIPIGILATVGLYRYAVPRLQAWARLPRRWRAHAALLVTAGVLLVTLPSNLYYVGWRVLDMSREQAPYFLLRDEYAALRWLRASSGQDDIVLSALDLGQYIPGLAGNRAFLAHWANTLDYFGKRAAVERFFQPTTDDAARLDLLAGNHIRYLVWGPAERALGTWDPHTVNYLTPVWSSREVTIFTVQ